MNKIFRPFVIWTVKVNAIWNSIMAVIGAPFIIFIFICFVESTWGFVKFPLYLFFILGTLFASSTILEGIIGAFFSILMFNWLRPWFVAGGFLGIHWWGHETAGCGAFCVFVVNILIELIIILSQLSQLE